tara:strand:+ start:422 stop:742 length:321 start_codon:yes stop_codon:yes gene_type:complete
MNWKNILKATNTVLAESNLPTLNIIVDMSGYLIKPEILTKNLTLLLPFVDEYKIQELYNQYEINQPLSSENKSTKINRLIKILHKSLPIRVRDIPLKEENIVRNLS